MLIGSFFVANTTTRHDYAESLHCSRDEQRAKACGTATTAVLSWYTVRTVFRTLFCHFDQVPGSSDQVPHGSSQDRVPVICLSGVLYLSIVHVASCCFHGVLVRWNASYSVPTTGNLVHGSEHCSKVGTLWYTVLPRNTVPAITDHRHLLRTGVVVGSVLFRNWTCSTTESFYSEYGLNPQRVRLVQFFPPSHIYSTSRGQRPAN